MDEEQDQQADQASDLTSSLQSPVPPKVVQEALRRAYILMADSPPPDRTKPYLFVMEPGCRPRWQALRPPSCTLGRLESSTVQISSMSVSRTHAMFSYEDEFWHVQDAASRHGTFVGTDRIQKRCLLSGDLIRCGDVYALFVDGRTHIDE